MGFLIQYSCSKCGYKSPNVGDVLIDPLGMSELNICTCKDCKSLFQRESGADHQPINKCKECGSENIIIHKELSPIDCPLCGQKEMNLECIGTFF